MRVIVKIAVFSAIILFCLNSCFKCYSCIAKGDNFNIPYDSNQVVSFINDSLNIINFKIKTEVHLPQSEYCGSIGSTSYGDCAGDLSATFTNNEENNITIKIYYNTMISDDVELPVYKNVIINNSSFVIFKNKATTSDVGSSVKELNTIIINGKTYNNIIEYANNNNSFKNNACIYMLYSKTDGLLSFHIKQNNYIEKWILKNK